MPNNPRAGGISRRIEGDDRTELKEALSSLQLPDGMGLIVRTAGVGKSAEALQWDLTFRLKHWDAIKKAAEGRPAPFLIHQESNVIVRAFRDYLRPDIGEILIDNPKVLELAKEHIAALGRPDFSSKIKPYVGEIPLFSHYQIESQIESAFQREVRLPSGGSIVIDSTEALTAIDINSARATRGGDIEETAFNTNLEAADEIARQLRLRDLGGLIVIDFIDMTPVRHQREVENRLRDAVRQDRARIQIGRISRFGLLEMSRQRLSPSLGESTHHICPRCAGTGTVRDNESLSLSILRLIEEEALKENTKEVHAIVPVPIASYLLNEKRESVNAIEKRQGGVRAVIVPNDQMQTPHYHVLRVRKGEEISALSYLLPQIHEAEMLQPSEEVPSERRRPEQPALAAFALQGEAPPSGFEQTSAPEEPVQTRTTTVNAPAAPVAEKPGFVSRLLSGLKGLFAPEPQQEVKPVEVPKAETETTEAAETRRNNDRRNQRRQGGRRDRNGERGERTDRGNRGEGRDNNRDNRGESRDTRENNREPREDQRRNRRNPEPVVAEARIEEVETVARDEQQQQPRRERSRRRSDDKRRTQPEEKVQDVVVQEIAAPVVSAPVVQEDADQEDRQPAQRRQRRQLTQKVRFESEEVDHEAEAAAQLLITGSRPAERPVEPAFTSHEEAGAETNYSADNDDNQNDNARENGMPRRSRRSPRHLRVSGQRRRRYRDERYPTQSPMPMAGAFVSPEMASGKVWITYPVAQAYEQHVNETEAPEVLAQQVEIAQENTPVLNETTEAAPQTVVETPVNEPAKVEPEAVVAEFAPQETPVEAAPEVAAQPVADEPVLVEPETAEPVQETPVVAVAPKAQEPIVVEPVTVIAEPEIQVQAPVAAPEAEPVAQVQPVAETAISTEAAAPRFKLHATAPMTKAPAPAYVQEPARHSDWVRPEFDFEGKGSAGGHAAVSTATAPATKPEMPSE